MHARCWRTSTGGSRRASGRPTWWTRRRSSPRWSRGPNDGGEMSIHRSSVRRIEREESTMINCYAFAAVPPFAQGLVRDLRVRWALEEAGLPYQVTLVGAREGAIGLDAYRAIQPFGQ